MRSWRPDRAVWAVAVVALLAPALLAGGCGNERRDFRVQKLNPAIEDLSVRRSELATILRAARPERRRDVAALRDQLNRVRYGMRRIAALDPPGGTEEQFYRYTRANAVLLAALRRFVNAFAARDEAGQARTGAEVRSAVARADRAKTRLQRSLR